MVGRRRYHLMEEIIRGHAERFVLNRQEELKIESDNRCWPGFMICSGTPRRLAAKRAKYSSWVLGNQ